MSGNTTVKKLEIKKELPTVVRKKTLKAAAKKKASTTTASTAKQKAVLDGSLDKQLKELESELKQTKAQLRNVANAEKSPVKS